MKVTHKANISDDDFLIGALKKEFYTKDLLKSHGKSFYFAKFFLSSDIAAKANHLYTVCRIIDDVVDNSGDLKEDIDSNLVRLENLILAHTDKDYTFLTRDCRVSRSSLLTLLKGVRSDLQIIQIDTTDNLLQYCYQVAGTVGLMMCDLMQIDSPEARLRAIDLGIAMQLTNISRDVWLDAYLSRVYLPIEIVGKCSPESIKNNSCDDKDRLIKGISQLVSLADSFYSSGISGLRFVPDQERLALFIAAKLYQEIGTRVRKNGFLTPGIKSYVPFSHKLGIALKCFLKFLVSPSRLERYSLDNDIVKSSRTLSFYKAVQ